MQYYHHQLNSLFLSLLLLCIISSKIASGTPQQPPLQYACDMAVAEECFGQLFGQMPICSASEESAELAFRCVHYNVLDACFSRPIEPRIKCAPKQIGHAARIAYGKRVDFCLFSRENHYTTTAVDQPQSAETDHIDHNSGEEQQQHRRRSSSPHGQRRRHSHQQQQQGGIHRMPSGASIGLLAPPTELQFISLFGYLQIQCRPPIHRKSLEAKGGGNRRSQSLRDSSAGGYAAQQPGGLGNCSAPELGEITALCEDEIRQRQLPPHFVLERHKLLRIKLDASSKLLQFPETRPEDECLMVRSVLSDIYLIHQKYCFHATVTKCMCERLRFERTCGIQCANLEPFGLPLHRELLWSDFRGRLSGAQRTKSHPFGIPVQIAMLIITLILIPAQLVDRRHLCCCLWC